MAGFHFGSRRGASSGVAQRPIVDLDGYVSQLSARRDPIAGTLQQIFSKVRRRPRRVVFAEGEEERVIRAATSFVAQRLGTALLIGREDEVMETAEAAGIELREGIEIINARLSDRNRTYADFLYGRLQRKGYLFRDCQRLVNTDRNFFGATMVALGDSCTFGWGTDTNWTEAFETRTGRAVRNLAVPGYSAVQGSRALAQHRPSELDVLVLNFGANDGHMVFQGDLARLGQRSTAVGRVRHALAGLHLVQHSRRWLYTTWARGTVLAWQSGAYRPRVTPDELEAEYAEAMSHEGHY